MPMPPISKQDMRPYDSEAMSASWKPPVADVVNRPPHYTFSEYEPIKVIRAWGLNFALGNVVKYLVRAGRKDPVTLIVDLKKARVYLNDEIASLEQEQAPVPTPECGIPF